MTPSNLDNMAPPIGLEALGRRLAADHEVDMVRDDSGEGETEPAFVADAEDHLAYRPEPLGTDLHVAAVVDEDHVQVVPVDGVAAFLRLG